MDAASQEFRQRRSHNYDVTSDDQLSDKHVDPAWKAQLTAARAGLAERVKQQQHADGVYTPGDDDDLVADSALNDSPAEQAAEPSSISPHPRRGSVSSLHSEVSDADDEVHELLTGHKRRQAASDSLEDVVEEPPTPGFYAEVQEKAAKSSNRTDPTADDPESDKCCRICFSDDVEDETLGKLFSPCVCRGTSRYVHQACLARWRAASANSTSFYECDQCHYRYKYARTGIAHLVTHRATLLAVTCILFTLLLYVAGFMANRMIAIAERRAQSGSMFEEWFVSDHVILSEGVKEAVDFIGKRVEDVAHERSQNRYTSRALGVILHFTKGLSLVGLMSLFQAYIATSFFSPLGRGMYRMMRPAARRGGRDTGANSISQVVIVLLVIVGAAKAVRQVYRGTEWLSKRVLKRIGDFVLDIGST